MGWGRWVKGWDEGGGLRGGEGEFLGVTDERREGGGW